MAWIVAGLICFGVVAGAFISLFAGWIPRPAWMTTAMVVGALCAVVAVAIGIAVIAWVLQQRAAAPSTPSSSARSTPPSLSVPPVGWRQLVAQEFAGPAGMNGSPLRDGCTTSSSAIQDGQLFIKLDSCSDYTAQVAFEVQPHDLSDDYYVAADVQYLSGPSDGYCAILINWQDSEHYYAFKINRTDVEVTRDKGGLPHQLLEGPRTEAAVRADAASRLEVVVRDDTARFYVNDWPVSVQEIAGVGQVWLGAQAANRSDLVRCGFDNIELWVPR